jgi:hypothetical protein
MRTTVDLDPDLLRRLRDEAHRRRVSFKDLLNRVLRRGLESPARGKSHARAYRCPTFRLGQPAASLDLDRALAVAAALEDEEIARELNLRK